MKSYFGSFFLAMNAQGENDFQTILATILNKNTVGFSSLRWNSIEKSNSRRWKKIKQIFHSSQSMDNKWSVCFNWFSDRERERAESMLYIVFCRCVYFELNWKRETHTKADVSTFKYDSQISSMCTTVLYHNANQSCLKQMLHFSRGCAKCIVNDIPFWPHSVSRENLAEHITSSYIQFLKNSSNFIHRFCFFSSFSPSKHFPPKCGLYNLGYKNESLTITRDKFIDGFLHFAEIPGKKDPSKWLGKDLLVQSRLQSGWIETHEWF